MKMPIHPTPRIFHLIIIAFDFLCFCKCHEDSLYHTCATSLCGSVPIRYPFGISNQGCGHPRFQIECVQGWPILAIKDQRFAIKEFINGDPKIEAHPKIRVVDERVLLNPCGLPDAAVDLNGSPFRRVPPFSNLTLFLRCYGNTWADRFRIQQLDCNASSYLGLSDPKLIKDGSRSCNSTLQIPITRGDLPEWLFINLLKGGFDLEWDLHEDILDQQYCRDCESTKGICGYGASSSKAGFLCYCPHGVHPKSCSGDGNGGKSRAWAISVSCIGGTLLVAAATLFTAVRWRQRRKPHASDESRGSERRFEHIGDIVNDASSKLKRANSNFPVMFSYRELQQATGFFDKKKELGNGGFGSVFLGTLCDGRTVAVKRLHEDNSRRVEHFVNEVNILSSVCHPNLVRLYGCCQDRQNLLLVYEYVPNGTLADHLHGEKKGKGLLWEARLNIALETAQALAFLHFCVEPPIFHRDVKSTNILLDENLRVKVADFGLSRLIPLKATHVSTVPQGTPGYLDPDYHQCYQLTDKSDVYSFGVVLVEIISAKVAVDITRDRKEISLANLAILKIQSGALHELVDPQLGFEYNPLVKSMITGVAELALRCLASQKDDRPSMIEVVSQLQQINQMGYGFMENQKDWQKSLEIRQEEHFRRMPSSGSLNSVQGKWPSSTASPETSA